MSFFCRNNNECEQTLANSNLASPFNSFSSTSIPAAQANCERKDTLSTPSQHNLLFEAGQRGENGDIWLVCFFFLPRLPLPPRCALRDLFVLSTPTTPFLAPRQTRRVKRAPENTLQLAPGQAQIDQALLLGLLYRSSSSGENSSWGPVSFNCSCRRSRRCRGRLDL